MPCSNRMFPGDPAWGMLTDPSAIHPKRFIQLGLHRAWLCRGKQRGETLTLSPCIREDLIPASSCMALRQPQTSGKAASPGRELEPRMGGEHKSPTANLWF